MENNFGYGAAIAAVIFVVTMLTGTAQLIYTRKRRVQL
jgi:raffinose/stachyose/melibiose transport system permease protein